MEGGGIAMRSQQKLRLEIALGNFGMMENLLAVNGVMSAEIAAGNFGQSTIIRAPKIAEDP